MNCVNLNNFDCNIKRRSSLAYNIFSGKEVYIFVIVCSVNEKYFNSTLYNKDSANILKTH